jgi:molybdopterin-dependent oxidoreductase alpha subunit
MMKALITWDEDPDQPPTLDQGFISEHTSGFALLAAGLAALSWETIEADSGLTRAEIEEAARIYARSRATILCYGMGLTQHRSSSSTVQQLANLLLLRGNIGRPGAGLSPLRGHSNVQGDRTVGIWEKPSETFLAAMDRVFGFRSPRKHGHTVVETIAAMERGEARVFIGLGGNFAVAAPDPHRTFAALPKLDLTAHIATKLNRTHLLPGRESLLLPCLGRTEFDEQAGGRQAVTVEDSMSMVHASKGMNPPASAHLKSEVAIVAGIGQAVFGARDPVDWQALTGDYDQIRDLIEAVLPELFADFNARIRTPGGFRLAVGASERVWRTANGKANFLPFVLDGEDVRRGDDTVLVLTTLRSQDQYNTTIYGSDDRYRGVFGRRDVVFVSPGDLADLGLANGDLVDIVAAWDESGARIVRGFTAVERDIPPGCVAAYYPEANGLVALDDHDRRSGTPAYKSVPVRIRRHVER